MFDHLLTRITSPAARRRHTYHCPEVHSDPEDNDVDVAMVQVASSAVAATPRKPRILERRRNKGGRRVALENGLRQARSLGRLDGLKEAERLADYGRLIGGSQPMLDGRRKDLDRIQDLFPQDYLGLHALEPNSSYHVKSKSFRKKSLGDLRSITAEFTKSQHFTAAMMTATTNCNRAFLVEAPCAMALPSLPLTAKPRHLFLFSDLLLVAKPRNGGTFKLKESVRVSEIWLAPCSESDTGFLLGWPNPARTLLVRFCTQAARDSWWRELQKALAAQLRLEPPVTNIKVVYRDPLSGTECSKTLGVGPEASTGDIARLAFDENRTKEWGYTLWARDRDSPPALLLGCERPHSIQLARLRQSLCAEEGFDLTHCNNNRVPCDIVFELKPNCKPTPRKTPLKLFRKNSCRIFGVPLARLCVNNTLPAAIFSTLKALYQRGPSTQGIFRRCASARALRELRERVDSQGATVCDEINSSAPLLLAALLKDFLRSLPSPLLAGHVADWLAVAATGRLEHLRRMVAGLPRENHLLLAHVVAVLGNIARRSRYNLMSASNLGVCLGPSLLWEASQNAPMRTLPTLVEMLISNCQTLFGSQIMSMLGEVANDSGAEESDSLHSLGLSLDSSAELSKDQKSLSRDSGLTLSEDDRDSPSLHHYNNTPQNTTSTTSSTTSSSSLNTNNPISHNKSHHNTSLPLLSSSSITTSPVKLAQQQNGQTNNHHFLPFHRSDWSRQAARMRSLADLTQTQGWMLVGDVDIDGDCDGGDVSAGDSSSAVYATVTTHGNVGSTENLLLGPPIPPRRPPLPNVGPLLRHLPPVHLPPIYRPPPPPPPVAVVGGQQVGTYATARLLLVTDAESESYV